MADPALRAVMARPFAEQVAAYRLRLGNLVPTARWDDISRSAHDRAFMVAGAAKADLLADLAMAVDKAISEGRGLDEFRRDFRGIVERRGWHGWTGEGTAGGEAWRTRTIYRTNASTTYAAGRSAQLREGGYEFWVYKHGGSRDPRPEHLALDGVTQPPDHEFWQKFAPPNGWGCSCYVLGARSARMARRLGGDPEKALPEGWDRIDARTGAPRGIDRGWDYAPGLSAVDAIRDLRPKLDHLPDRPSIDLIQDWLERPAFADWLRDPDGNWPLVRIPEADVKALGLAPSVRVADMSSETVRKQLREHPELTPRDYAQAQQVVSDPSHRVQDGPRSMVYIKEIADAETGGYVLVVKATGTGRGLFLTSFRRLSRDAAERDRTIRRHLRKGV
ncbi:phage minor head protein [Halodurantibacterium flavum]|uniref:Phage minor head protein n=1 Tax=Halodurantibacterium flavum TaxID=1382802 RepID=A0ABW4S9H0_9RHOB